MAELSHRNVVTVYDVGVHGEHVFVAMQLIDGTTLREWLSTQTRSMYQVLRVLCEAGAGLAAAHAVRLVHRDFKPDNVMVSKRGTARVTDFGLARRADLDSAELSASASRLSRVKVVEVDDVAGVTRTGAVVGTPAYMAPEQAQGQPSDARADQFSFCVTAWEALHGARPFAGRTWSEIYRNILAQNIDATERRGRVSRTVTRALRRGLAVDPGDRFPSMDDLLHVMEAAGSSSSAPASR
jgi:serine/threonine protein kinase